MMNIKKIIDDIKNQIRAEEVKNKIASDLGLKLDKSNKCLCFNHNEKVPKNLDVLVVVILTIYLIITKNIIINHL